MTQQEKFTGIHTLRAVAALSVFLLHTIAITANFYQPLVDLTWGLRFGVPLFFALSAFSLMYSTEPYRGEKNWVSRFYLKRFFRIAPLYYFMMVVEVMLLPLHLLSPSVAIFGLRPPPPPEEVALNLLFLFGLVPEYVNGIVWLGWSVGVEMLFYLAFPLLILSIRGIGSAVTFLIASIVLGEVMRPYLDSLVPAVFDATLSYLHVIPNLRYFAFGLLAYQIYKSLQRMPLASGDAGGLAVAAFHLSCAALTACLVWAVFVYNKTLVAFWHADMAVWGAVFVVLCVWLTIRPIRILGWGPFQYLGERSYSLYLVHFPVVIFGAEQTGAVYRALLPYMGEWAVGLAILATYLVVVLLSELTYRFIERPGMRLGRLIERKLTAKLPSQGIPGQPG